MWDWLSDILPQETDSGGNQSVDWSGIASAILPLVGGALISRSGSDFFQPRPPQQGYQEPIPDYTGIRQVVPNTYNPDRRPGSGGQRYFSDMVYTPTADPAAQNQAYAYTDAQKWDLAGQNLNNPAQEAPWDPEWYRSEEAIGGLTDMLSREDWSDEEKVQQVIASMDANGINPYMLSEATGVPVTRIYDAINQYGRPEFDSSGFVDAFSGVSGQPGTSAPTTPQFGSNSGPGTGGQTGGVSFNSQPATPAPTEPGSNSSYDELIALLQTIVGNLNGGSGAPAAPTTPTGGEPTVPTGPVGGTPTQPPVEEPSIEDIINPPVDPVAPVEEPPIEDIINPPVEPPTDPTAPTDIPGYNPYYDTYPVDVAPVVDPVTEPEEDIFGDLGTEAPNYDPQAPVINENREFNYTQLGTWNPKWNTGSSAAMTMPSGISVDAYTGMDPAQLVHNYNYLQGAGYTSDPGSYSAGGDYTWGVPEDQLQDPLWQVDLSTIPEGFHERRTIENARAYQQGENLFDYALGDTGLSFTDFYDPLFDSRVIEHVMGKKAPTTYEAARMEGTNEFLQDLAAARAGYNDMTTEDFLTKYADGRFGTGGNLLTRISMRTKQDPVTLLDGILAGTDTVEEPVVDTTPDPVPDPVPDTQPVVDESPTTYIPGIPGYNPYEDTGTTDPVVDPIAEEPVVEPAPDPVTEDPYDTGYVVDATTPAYQGLSTMWEDIRTRAESNLDAQGNPTYTPEDMYGLFKYIEDNNSNEANSKLYIQDLSDVTGVPPAQIQQIADDVKMQQWSSYFNKLFSNLSRLSEAQVTEAINFVRDYQITPQQISEMTGYDVGDLESTFGALGLPISYAAGGKVAGPSDGMADQVPATIGGTQEARLSHGEFVIPADVVSHLGNGNTDAGAEVLYGMLDNVREARTGSREQGRQINPNEMLPI